LPEAYKDGKTTTVSKGTTDAFVHKPSTVTTSYGRHCNVNSYTPTVVTAEPEAKFFQRTDSKKPSKSDLEIMFSKLDLIKKGEYVATLVPTPEDSPNDEPISEVKGAYADYGYMNGMYE